MEHQECVRVITQTPTPPTLSPPALPLGSGEELPVDHIMQGKNNNIYCIVFMKHMQLA